MPQSPEHRRAEGRDAHRDAAFRLPIEEPPGFVIVSSPLQAPLCCLGHAEPVSRLGLVHKLGINRLAFDVSDEDERDARTKTKQPRDRPLRVPSVDPVASRPKNKHTKGSGPGGQKIEQVPLQRVLLRYQLGEELIVVKWIAPATTHSASTAF